MALWDRFSPSWPRPGNLLAVSGGPKMAPESLSDGLQDASEAQNENLQKPYVLQGLWRPGGVPGGPKIGLKRLRGGIRVHPYRHTFS